MLEWLTLDDPARSTHAAIVIREGIAGGELSEDLTLILPPAPEPGHGGEDEASRQVVERHGCCW